MAITTVNSYLTASGLNFRSGTTGAASILLDSSTHVIKLSGNFNVDAGSLTIGGNPIVTGSSSSEGDTLQSVTARGNTTTTDIKAAHISGTKLTLSDDNIIDSHGEILDFQANDLIANGKHIRADFGIWARSAGGRNMGIDGNTNFMQLYTNGTEKVRITQVGDVGIGTTNPLSNLDVKTQIRVRDSSSDDTHVLLDSNATEGRLRINNGANWGLIARGQANNPYLGAYKLGSLNIVGFSTSDGANIDHTLTKFDFANQRVGIGTTSPQSLLHIYETGAGAPQFRISRGSNNQVWVQSIDSSARFVLTEASSEGGTQHTRFQIDDAGETLLAPNGGNVGIGTTAPAVNLHVESSTSAQFKVGNGTQFVRLYADADEATILADGSVDMRFYVGGGEKMRLDTAGRLGIGSTSPQGKLDAGADTDQNIFLGRARFGSHVTDYLYLSHYDNATSTSYALKQSPAGSSAINAKAGQNVSMSVNNSNIVFVQGSTSNVGIGTTNPARNLSVASSSTNALIQLANSTTTYAADNGLEIFISDTNAGIVNRENGYLRFDTSNTERVRIAAGGKVGIGTTDPAELLHIDGVSPIIRLRDSNAAGTPLAHIDASDGALKLQADYSDETASSFLTLEVDGSEHVRVASDGSVGIGSTNPVQKLDVAGVIRSSVTSRIQADVYNNSANSANIIYRSSTDTIVGNNASALVVQDGGNVGIGTTNPAYILDIHTASNDEGIRLYTTPNTRPAAELLVDSATNGNADFRLYHGTAINTRIQSNPAKSSYFNAGNVGIGTTNPSYPLHVRKSVNGNFAARLTNTESTAGANYGVMVDGGTNSSDTSFEVRNSNLGDTYFKIRGDGNVGIGVTNPSRKLFVQGDAEINTNLVVNTAVYTKDWYGIGSNDQRILTSAGTAQVTIKNGGNVGIGTTAPQETLHVYSTSNSRVEVEATTEFAALKATNNQGSYGWYVHNTTDSFRLFDFGASTDYITVSGNGNVGIGTSNPSQKLEVNGAIKSSQYLYLGSDVSLYRDGSNILRTDDALHANGGISVGGVAGGGFIYNRSETDSYIKFDDPNIVMMGGNVGIGSTSPDHKLRVGDGNICIDSDHAYIGNIFRSFVASNTNIRLNNTTDMQFNLHNSSMDFKFGLQGSTPFVTIGGDGKVGIGTTNPAYDLHVHKANTTGPTIELSNSEYRAYINAWGSAAMAGRANRLEINAGETDFAVGADTIRFQIGNVGDSNEKMRIDSAGNVGIGTSSPAKQLTLNAAEPFIRLEESSSGGNKRLDLFVSNSTGVIGANQSAQTMMFQTVGETRMTIEAGGNIGIGNESAGAKVDIRTDSSTTNGVALRAESSTGAYFRLYHGGAIDTDGNITAARFIQDTNAGNNFYAIQLSRSSLSDSNPDIYGSDNGLVLGANSSEDVLKLDTGNTVLVRGGSDPDTNSYKADFAVGVGTSPQISWRNQQVQIGGTDMNWAGKVFHDGTFQMAGWSSHMKFYTQSSSSSAYDIYFSPWNGSSVSEAMRILGEGRVGIGTNSPSVLLDVYNTGGWGNIDIDGTSGGELRFQKAGSTYLAIYASDTSSTSSVIKATDHLHIYSNADSDGSHSIYLNDAGNVGIGTVSPSVKLDVNGNIKASQVGVTNIVTNKIVKFGGTYLDDSIIHDDGTNIGIGTTSINAGAKVTIQAANSNQIHTGLVINSYQSTTATAGNGVGIVMGQNNGVYSSKIANVWTNNNPSYLQTNIAFYTMHDSYAAGSETEKMRLTSDGRLGIGVTNPSQRLEVATNTDASAQIGRAHIGYVGFADHAGFAHLDNASTSNYSLLQSSAGDTFINSAASRHIYFRDGNATIGGFNGNDDFYVDTDTLYVDASEGNVGIGTSSPDYTLTVDAGATNEIARFRSTDNDAMISIQDNTDAVYIGLDASADIMSLGFSNAFTTGNLSIDTAGQVGIGTTNPHALLEVSNNSNDATLIVSNKTNGANGAYLRLLEAGTAFDTYGYLGGYIQYDGNNNLINIGRHNVNGTTFSDDVPAISIKRSDGKVGIGTTSPSQTLHVEGTARVTGHTDLASSVDISSKTRIYNKLGIGVGSSWVDPANGIDVYGSVAIGSSYIGTTAPSNGAIIQGNVGIGTSSPSYDLHVEGEILAESNMLLGGDGTYGSTYGAIGIGTTSLTNGHHRIFAKSSDHMYFAAASSKGFRFRANGGSTDHVSIPSNGNVGIGTTNPSSKLEVQGTIQTQVYGIGSLPSASPAGQRAMVNDSYYTFGSSTIGQTVYAGGSAVAPVYSDGSYWRYG